jgi:hypothetical protein
VFAAARQAKVARRAAFVNALLHPPGEGDDERAGEGEERPPPSFDGGARIAPPMAPESHEQTLSKLLASREANAGRHL